MGGSNCQLSHNIHIRLISPTHYDKHYDIHYDIHYDMGVTVEVEIGHFQNSVALANKLITVNKQIKYYITKDEITPLCISLL